MKKLNSASRGILLLIMLTAPLIVHANGTRIEKEVVSIELKLDNDDTFELNGDGFMLVTPSLNFLKTYHFTVPQDILEQIDFGFFANKIIGIRLRLRSGEVLVGIGFLNKAGNLNFNIHRNGAGGLFPKGWF